MNEPLIHAVELAKTYVLADERVVALEGLSLDVARGEAIAITGPSGSGKTTLLNLVGGLDRPTAGAITVGGRDLAALGSDDLAAYRRVNVGFVFQAFRLLPYLTALENVALPLLLAGIPRGAATTRAMEDLERIGLGGRARHRPPQLSAGAKPPASGPRAIAHHPPPLPPHRATRNPHPGPPPPPPHLVSAAPP